METADGGIGNSSYNLSLYHWPHEAYLVMRRDGNLVFRNGAGRVLWSTHTAGTGDHNYARLLDSGTLVVRTASGRTVWSSHTTSMIRVTGEHLMPGHTLVNRNVHPITELAMRTTGDLVLRRGSQRVWHTDTHVHGSRLVISRAGRMVIVAPDGEWMWHSPKVGRPAVLNVAMRGRITFANLRHFRPCWVRPAGSNPDCGTG